VSATRPISRTAGNRFEGNKWRLDELDASEFLGSENRLMTGE
jgi:hypothetical protein